MVRGELKTVNGWDWEDEDDAVTKNIRDCIGIPKGCVANAISVGFLVPRARDGFTLKDCCKYATKGVAHHKQQNAVNGYSESPIGGEDAQIEQKD